MGYALGLVWFSFRIWEPEVVIGQIGEEMTIGGHGEVCCLASWVDERGTSRVASIGGFEYSCS